MNARYLRIVLFTLVSWVLLLPSAAKADGNDTSQTGGSSQAATIYLKSGSYCTGKLLASQGGDNLVWQGAAFTAPFTFSFDAVNVVHFPLPEKLPQPVGDFCFELTGGDLLFGSLVALDGQEAVLDISGLGQIHVERRILRRMFRWTSGDMLYFGPNGMRGWQSFGGGPATFREEAGQLVADQKAAAIRRDFGAPPLACFEFELSWSNRPDFELALGTGDDMKSAQRAFRFEIWDNKLIVRRATEREADVAALQKIGPGPGRAHLTAFLDQQNGHIIVFSPGGEQLADLTVVTGKPQPFGGIQLVNKSGDIRLERLRISRWNGNAPRPAERDQSRIHGPNGAVVYRELKSYDAPRSELVVATDRGEQRIPLDQARDVFLPDSKEVAPQGLRAVHLTGLRVSGELLKVDEKGIWLKRPGIREPLVSPIAALHALTVLENLIHPPKSTGRTGRLELETARLHGCFIDGREGDTSCLVWQPSFSSTASPLARGVSAKIVYRDSPPAAAIPTRNDRLRQAAAARAIPRPLTVLDIENRAMAMARMRRPQTGQPVLHLRTGDTFACTVTAINDKGVSFKSAFTDSMFIPHAQVKVLELMPEATPVAIAKVKKERLLTLPRMQRDNPPTQLIRAANGDYLRGRLVAMDDKELQVEVRLETKTLPRQDVARIIWLHPDELDPEAKPATDTPQATRVQALPADGNRLTFFAEQLAGSTLSGKSALLGQCRVDLAQIDQLLVGAAIEESASSLAFHQWKLTPALEPLPTDEGEAGDSEGMESSLVGKPAPDFELDELDGKKFRLSREKGTIVVLDFWASWCGPCLQAMPQVNKVVTEFGSAGVKLVSVNLQETSDRIHTVLERLDMKSIALLDQEGTVAEKYGAMTIPQTVIVDRDGNVARVFVGGGANFEERLRAALQQVAAGPPKKE